MFKNCELCLKSTEEYSNITSKILECLAVFRHNIVDCINSAGCICQRCEQFLIDAHRFVQSIQSSRRQLRELANNDNVEQGTETGGEVRATSGLPMIPESGGEHRTDSENRTHTNRRTYKCGECPRVFINYHLYKEHENAHRQAYPNVHICELCFSLYADSESLQKHRDTLHTDGKYHCRPCAKSWKKKAGLLNHLGSEHHSSELIFYCDICAQTLTTTLRTDRAVEKFTSRSALVDHLLVTHLLVQETNNCVDIEFLDEYLQHTDESFDNLFNVQTVDLYPSFGGSSSPDNFAPFKCPRCEQNCKNQSELMHHLAQIHKEQVFFCAKCNIPFSSAQEMKDHHQGVHTRNERNDGDSVECPSHETEDRPFKCPYCKKGYRSAGSLRTHLISIHSALKRHMCMLCDKKYSTQDQLKKHFLSAHDEAKYVCEVCSKKFKQSSHLKQHMATHGGEKPIGCPHCAVRFWKKIDCGKHIAKFHQIISKKTNDDTVRM